MVGLQLGEHASGADDGHGAEGCRDLEARKGLDAVLHLFLDFETVDDCGWQRGTNAALDVDDRLAQLALALAIPRRTPPTSDLCGTSADDTLTTAGKETPLRMAGSSAECAKLDATKGIS